MKHWHCSYCEVFFNSLDKFEKHLENEHEMLDAVLWEKLDSSQIRENYQENFWCGFCKHIVNHYLRGDDARKERLDHMERHHENDNLKWGYPAKEWTVGSRNGVQITSPTRVWLP